MIYTSSYRALDLKEYKYQVLSISGDRGKMAEYTGECYPALAPKKEFWEVWHSNIGKVPIRENTKYYIREYYKQVLSKLDVNKEFAKLDNKILLCYEDPRAFCHRQIVASWFELYLGQPVLEVEQQGDKLVTRNTNPFIKNYLEEVIMADVDMMGFDNLASLNLFKKGDELEKKAVTNNDIEIAKYLKELAFNNMSIEKPVLKK